MDLILDFGAHLPKHLVPPYGKVVSLLTQTVSEWPKGSAMLTKEDRGIYAIKIWDKSKGEKLLNKKIVYHYDEAKNKKVSVTIQQKPIFKRYVNPKYVTLMGFNASPADQIKNDQIDKILETFGEIIVPTEDVYAEIFMTGKKKLRIDLNKGKDIPRDLHIQFDGESGQAFNISLRSFYKNQPYHCRKCKEGHTGDCPEWLREKEERDNLEKSKRDKTKTVMIGDSNLRCVNERGVMARVTSITGGKIGHIVNQVQFENLDKIENVVLSAGQNCIEDVETMDKKVWEKRTQEELKNYEALVTNLMKKGKKVFIVSVPPVPCTQRSGQTKSARAFINANLSKIVQQAVSKNTTGMAAYIDENDGNFNAQIDFTDERHLSQMAIERRIAGLDEVLPEGQKLKDPSLPAKPTCDPYRGCYGGYPVGCEFCCQMRHNVHVCPSKEVKQGTVRKDVSSTDLQTIKKPKT
ncbi:MAG: hypothetical protein MK234_02335 [Nitrospinales bacterium]|nr:hypothetical protein [Nitrospinales bacterium]